MDTQNEIYWKRKELSAKNSGRKIIDMDLFKKHDLNETVAVVVALIVYFIMGLFLGAVFTTQILINYGLLVV